MDGVANASGASPDVFFAISSTGTLSYVPSLVTGATTTKLVQVTRAGVRSPLTDVAGMTWFPRYSPDGTRVASLRSDDVTPTELYLIGPGRSGEAGTSEVYEPPMSSLYLMSRRRNPIVVQAKQLDYTRNIISSADPAADPAGIRQHMMP